jgi:hypothetical protein
MVVKPGHSFVSTPENAAKFTKKCATIVGSALPVLPMQIPSKDVREVVEETWKR